MTLAPGATAEVTMTGRRVGVLGGRVGREGEDLGGQD